jgi:hypothetical protein
MKLIIGFLFSLSVVNAQVINNEIEKVIIKKEKKSIEHKADRIIYNINSFGIASSSVIDNLRKIPGLIVSDIGGLMYQGKLLSVYLDNRTLNINSNELFSFL